VYKRQGLNGTVQMDKLVLAQTPDLDRSGAVAGQQNEGASEATRWRG
jgi:hypothetical protein